MYHRILVPVDLDEPGSWSKALPAAVALARCFAARLTLATVVSDAVAGREAQWSAIAYRELVDVAKAKLAHLASSVTDLGEIETRVGAGSIYGGILALADEGDIDLIVLASHRPEMKDYLLGANASRVVRHAVCSVMVVRA